jgi:thiol-disulfide isomerase/thioredoxin
MTQRSQWILVIVIVGILAGALVGGMALTPALAPVGVESKAPEFRALHVTSGDTVDLEAYRGEVVLLNIWATWCIPCEAEMPSIERLHQELGPAGLRVVAVSVDNGPPEDVGQWVADRELTFEILQDQSGRIERVYQTTGVPETFLIDREGVIVKKIIGAAEWDHPAQKTLIRGLLGADEGQGETGN